MKYLSSISLPHTRPEPCFELLGCAFMWTRHHMNCRSFKYSPSQPQKNNSAQAQCAAFNPLYFNLHAWLSSSGGSAVFNLALFRLFSKSSSLLSEAIAISACFLFENYLLFLLENQIFIERRRDGRSSPLLVLSSNGCSSSWR